MRAIGASFSTRVECRVRVAGANASLRAQTHHRSTAAISLRCAASKQDGNVLDRPAPGMSLKDMTIKKKPPMYRVMLHNDSANRREYVVKTLLKVVDGLTVDDAVNIMQVAHQENVALVIVCGQEEAEIYVSGLRKNGLTSTLEPQSGGGSNGNSSG